MDKYEKLYNEALERARKIHSEIVNNETIGFPGQIEGIFPELRESEDERIRKELINFLRSPFIKENLTDEKVTPWLDWLEKQKERDLDVVPELRPTAWGEGYQHGCKDTEEKYSRMMVCSPEEWNEEDNEMRLEAIRVLESGCERYRKESGCLPSWSKVIDWLKDFRPPFKPSEEQMEALAYASQVLGSDLSPRAAKASEELESIREQLKKL